MSHEQRLEKLERMLAARDGQPNFAENCAALRKEINRIKNRIATIAANGGDHV